MLSLDGQNCVNCQFSARSSIGDVNDTSIPDCSEMLKLNRSSGMERPIPRALIYDSFSVQ